MADYNSSLPVRTQSDADERLQSKIIDFTTPTQGMVVDADGNAHIEVHGNNPSGSDEILLLSELGAVVPDGLYHATNNTNPGNMGLVGHVRNASPDDTHQTQRITSITNGSKRALDVSIHDEDGAAFSSTNPVPVVIQESEGDEINDYLASSAVVAGATANHDYTVTALKTLYITQIEGSASGKAKMSLAIESGVGTGIFTNVKFTQFNSTANPNMSVVLREPIAVAAGVIARLVMINKDNQSQDVYSTISGHEV